MLSEPKERAQTEATPSPKWCLVGTILLPVGYHCSLLGSPQPAKSTDSLVGLSTSFDGAPPTNFFRCHTSPCTIIFMSTSMFASNKFLKTAVISECLKAK